MRVLTLGIGDVIIVGAGERLPVDGTVVRGGRSSTSRR